MPELPEVETIVRGLNKLIVGQTISAVDVIENRTVQFEKHDITDKISEHQISSINRRGKVMTWNLDNDYSLLFHLKMTGQIIYEKDKNHPSTNEQTKNSLIDNRFAGGHPTKSMNEELPDKSTRVIFSFKDGSKVYFNDQRKFGWVKLMPTSEVNNEKFISSLGPEFFHSAFNLNYLSDKLVSRKIAIKSLLLDQSVLAGLGNIYVDESLHLAKIHPAKTAGDLNKQEIKRLFESIKIILNDGLNYGGTSFSNYLDAQGQKGNYLQHARVFRRQGQQCQVCGELINKIKLNGRGTHFCPNCQKYPKGKND